MPYHVTQRFFHETLGMVKGTVEFVKMLKERGGYFHPPWDMDNPATWNRAARRSHDRRTR